MVANDVLWWCKVDDKFCRIESSFQFSFSLLLSWCSPSRVKKLIEHMFSNFQFVFIPRYLTSLSAIFILSWKWTNPVSETFRDLSLVCDWIEKCLRSVFTSLFIFRELYMLSRFASPVKWCILECVITT